MTLIDTVADNPRGYAFTALRQAYNRQLTWNQYAAAAKHGYYPTLTDYLGEGLDLFDKMFNHSLTSEDTVAIAFVATNGQQEMDYGDYTLEEVVATIIRNMGKSIAENFRGHFTYLKDEDGKEYVTTKYDTVLDQPTGQYSIGEEITIGGMLPMEEEGYAAIDDASLMRTRMALIAKRISADDMVTLTRYLTGEVDTITEACYGSKVATHLFQKRIRNACKGLEGSVVFG